MSAIEKIAYLDPRIDGRNQQFRKWYTEIGSETIGVVQTPAASFSNSTFSFKPAFANNDTTLADPSSINLYVPVTINMTCSTSGSGNCYQSGFESFRANPLEKCLDSLSIKIKNKQIDYHQNEIIKLTERLDGYNLNKLAVQYCDPTQTYNECNASNRSPFAQLTDNHRSRQMQKINIVTNTSTSATLTSTLPLNLAVFPPFTDKTGSFGINLDTSNFTFNWTNLTRMWSRDIVNHPKGSLTSLSITFSQPTLEFIQMNTKTPLPPICDYDYVNIEQHSISDSVATRAQYQTFDIMSSAFQMDSIPDRIILAVQPSKSSIDSSLDNSIGMTDTFCEILGAKITLGSNNSALDSFSQYQLYELSRKNGLDSDITFFDWIGENNGINLMGSVLCLSSSDLPSKMVPGVSEKTNLQIKLTVKSLNPSNNIQYEMSVIFIRDGILEISGNNCEVNYLPIQNKEELKMSDKPYRELMMLKGGSFGDSIKRFFSSAWSKIQEYGKPINQYLKDNKVISGALGAIPKYGVPLSAIAKTLGYGDDGGITKAYGDDGGILAFGDDAGEDGGEDGGDSFLAGGKIIRKGMSRYRGKPRKGTRKPRL